mmetsp:Transcript_74969/g.223390  ORF Transcript_74969/g.223390 Transcript_74969/m.223390 type:complete len:310 (+) Transcript_74969:424-1353(+)
MRGCCTKLILEYNLCTEFASSAPAELEHVGRHASLQTHRRRHILQGFKVLQHGCVHNLAVGEEALGDVLQGTPAPAHCGQDHVAVRADLPLRVSQHAARGICLQSTQNKVPVPLQLVRCIDQGRRASRHRERGDLGIRPKLGRGVPESRSLLPDRREDDVTVSPRLRGCVPQRTPLDLNRLQDHVGVCANVPRRLAQAVPIGFDPGEPLRLLWRPPDQRHLQVIAAVREVIGEPFAIAGLDSTNEKPLVLHSHLRNSLRRHLCVAHGPAQAGVQGADGLAAQAIDKHREGHLLRRIRQRVGNLQPKRAF